MRRPIKYLDNKFWIFLNDFFIRLWWSFFTKEKVICSSSWLSFSKKKLMNKTENKPMVKLLSHPMSTFKKSGMALKFKLPLQSCSVSHVFQYSSPKEKYSVTWLIKRMVFSSSSVILRSDKLSPCWLMMGIKRAKSPKIENPKITIVVMVARVLLNFK